MNALILALTALACTGGDRAAEEPGGAPAVRTVSDAEIDALVFSGEPTRLGASDEPPTMQPGQVQPPPAGGSGDGLKVIGVGPLGRVEVAQQVVAQFDRKMVALSDLDAMSAQVPLDCEGVEGSLRWAGTSTAVINPPSDAARWPMATEFSCVIPAGTAALDGAALAEEVRWSFSTRPPEVTGASPYSGASGLGLEPTIELRFNQDVDLEAVKPHVSLSSARGAVPFSLERRDKQGDNVVGVVTALAPDTLYSLEVSPGVVGREGPLPSENAFSTSFSTYPPLALERFYSDAGDPYVSLQLHFTTPIPAGEIKAHVSLDPEPSVGFEPGEGWESSSWYHGLLLDPGTTYTFTLTPGLEDIHGQTLAEGGSWTFTVGDFGPLVDAPTGTLVYPANNPPELPFRVRNVDTVSVATGALTVEEFIGLAEGGSAYEERFARTLEAPAVLRNEADRNAIGLLSHDLSERLSGGYGLMAVDITSPEYRTSRGELFHHRMLLQVTDLGVQLKLGPSGTTAWVTRLSDGEPVGGAQVKIHASGQVIEAATDGSGVAVFEDGFLPPDWRRWQDEVWVEARHGGDVALVNQDWDADLSPWRADIYTSFDADGRQIKTWGFSDRGVYKLGDPAYARVMARDLHKEGMDIPSGAVTWRLRDPQGSTIREGEGDLDDRGGFSVELELPEEGPLGYWDLSYTLVIDGREHSYYQSLPVKAYRAPSFRVDLSAPEAGLPGAEVRATANGRYLFGAPMGGAEARWSALIGETSFAPEGHDRFEFGPRFDGPWWRYYHEESPETLASGDGELDADGQLPVQVQVPTSDDGRTRRLTLSTAVTDPARQEVAGSASVLIHPAEFYVGLRASTGFVESGKPVQIEAITVTPDGAAVTGQAVEVSVARRTWDTVREKGMDGHWSWVSTPRDEPVTATTLSPGRDAASFSFTPEDAGYYVVDAVATDAAGRVTKAGTSLYAWGGAASWARSDDAMIELVPDKRRYSPGDTARVLVKSPRPGMKALITTEREGVLSRQVRTLETTASAVEIPLTEAHAPNLFVSVVLVEGAPPLTSPDGGLPRVYAGWAELDVSADSRRLEVDVTTDREQYQPRDEVSIKVKATRDGKPAAGAGVTLYAVDYAVLSLTGYETPDAFDTYYAKRALSVISADSRDRVLDRAEYLTKGGRTGGGGGVAFDSAMRTEFVTSPLWIGDLRAGKDGVAEAGFKLPDNLTTFKVMAVVDHGTDAFGSGEREITVSRPLIARPALPRFLRTGDRARAGVVLHNNLEEAVEVTVNAEATGVTLTGAPRTLEVGPHGAVEVPFALTEPAVGKAIFTFEAVSDAGDKDAVLWTLPVSRSTSKEVVATSGTTTDATSETVGIPADAEPDAGGLTLTLAPTVMVGMDGPVKYLLDYPHGCVEQVSSRTFAALMALDFYKQAGLTVSEEDLRATVSAGLDKLETFYTSSGGLAYWPGRREPHPTGSAWALEVLVAAKRAGFEVEDWRIEALVRFSRQVMDGRYNPSWWGKTYTHSARSRIALALARAGSGDAGFNAALFERRDEMSLVARAELLEALYQTPGNEALAAPLSRELTALVRVEPTSASMADPTPDRWRAMWYSDDLATASYLSAILAAPAADQPLAPKLAKQVVQGRKGSGWYTTWSTSASLRALAAYARAYEADTGAVKAAVTLAGDQLFKGALTAGAAETVEVGMSALTPGDLNLSADGGRLYYEARLTYMRPILPPRDEGFTVRRSYSLKSGAAAGGAVTPGALMEVTLEVVTPVTRYNVALVDPLPAGLESVDTGFATTDPTLSAGGYDDYDTGYYESPEYASAWAFDHIELRDDAVALFADYLPPGVYRYSYLARATTPGDYAHPAAHIEEMYAPEIFGRTEAGRFVVGAPELAGR